MSFFGDSYNEKKLKANLKLAINRLKLVEKKKTEIALRARKEIADYLKMNKIERAKIRVEHIIREDYLVEALEIIEMQCDLILARIALLGNGKGKNNVPHVSIHEAVDSILWAYPQVSGDCQELKIVVGQLSILFGKQYVHEVQNKAGDENPHVNVKLVSRLDPSTPKAFIIETYLQAIAEAYDVDYQADPQVMAAYARQNAIREEDLINIGGNVDKYMPPPPGNQPGSHPLPANYPPSGGNNNAPYPGPGTNQHQPQQPYNPPQQQKPFGYPSQQQSGEFDQMPPTTFVAPSEPAPQPPNNMQHSNAPDHGVIYDDGQNLNQGNTDFYQAPSITPARNDNYQQQSMGQHVQQTGQKPPNAKSKEAEQQYHGGQSSSVQPPPSYTVINDADADLSGYRMTTGHNSNGNTQPQQRQSNADDDFDIDALMPSIPTGFKGNNNDDDDQPGNAGGGDFDDLEARFANLKK